jgi:hypothetical protein
MMKTALDNCLPRYDTIIQINALQILRAILLLDMIREYWYHWLLQRVTIMVEEKCHVSQFCNYHVLRYCVGFAKPWLWPRKRRDIERWSIGSIVYPSLSMVASGGLQKVTCVSCGLDYQIRIRMGKVTWEYKCKLGMQLFIFSILEAPPD